MRKAESGALEQLTLGLPRPKRRRLPKRGRPATGKRVDPRHRPRGVHLARNPVHVTLRVRKDVPRLRKLDTYRAIRQALLKLASEDGMRVVHTSIQHNHLHFLVEASDLRQLSRGMQGLATSLAKRINRACGGRVGKVFAYRFHATEITSPRQARNALSYVLNNWRHHAEDSRTPATSDASIDPYSTAVWFDGWLEANAWLVPRRFEPLPEVAAKTWLLREGWRRAGGPISVHAVP